MDGELAVSVKAPGSRGRCAPGAHIETPSAARPRLSERPALSVGDVAAKLEHRLYLSEPTCQSVRDGCVLAIRYGLSSVIARPEVVPTVGQHLAGTSVGVVTLPGWRDCDVEPLATTALHAEARRLTAEGATDLGMLADVERLKADGGRRFADEVTALVEAMRASGTRVRVVLDTDGLTPDATATACELLGATGAWLVQGGSWRGAARTGLSRIQLMRAALPDEVTLKWTFPVRSVDSMMICIAEGVDRFNGDPESILEDAARRTAICPLFVPVRELDY
jgi:deoxyribose-phosphate aldolase